jgi:hypothetical protein
MVARRSAAAAQAPPPSTRAALPALLAMLCASTCMAVAQQYVINLGAAHKTTLSVRRALRPRFAPLRLRLHALQPPAPGCAEPAATLRSWTMYAADVLLSLTGGGASEKKACGARKPRSLALIVVPALDVTGCVLAYFGMERLGAGPFSLYFSCILALSAGLSRVALGKKLSTAQLSGIALVSVGLVARSLLADAGALGDDALGVGLTLASTTAYAVRTVVMEATRLRGGPSGGELSAAIGRLGFSLLTLWQLAYTLPRFDALVSQPMAAAGVTVARAALHHGAYVAARCLFVLSQNRVISVAGATGVGLVTAVRSVVVALASSALFCSTTPSQCLTLTQLACAGLVVAGGATYALAPPAAPAAPHGKQN